MAKHVVLPDQQKIAELKQIHQQRLFELKKRKARLGFGAPPEIELEIQEIGAALIELDDIEREAKGTARDQYESGRLGWRQQRIRRRLEGTQSKFSPIIFANRRYELEYISNPRFQRSDFNSPTFLFIEAPLGLGKSKLLIRAARELEDLGWFVCLVDFKEEESATENRDVFLDVAQLSLSDFSRELWELSTVDELSDAVATSMAKESHRVAVFLDGVDTVKQNVSEWIMGSFVPSLEAASRDTQQGELLFVISGRRIVRPWTDRSKKYDNSGAALSLSLSPFTLDVIENTIRCLDQELSESKSEPGNLQRSSLNAKAIARIARDVQSIGGGHPKCIEKILTKIERYDYRPSQAYLRQNKVAIYNACVSTTCSTILDSLSSGVREIFPYICVFRCYNPLIIDLVVKWADECSRPFHYDRSAPEIFKELRDSGLIRWFDRKSCYVDNVVRRIVSQGLWLNPDTQPLAYELNGRALKYYDACLQTAQFPNKGQAGAKPGRPVTHTEFRAMIVEHLHHLSVDLEITKVKQDVALRRFQETLIKDLDRFNLRFDQDADLYDWEDLLRELSADIENDEETEIELHNITTRYSYQEFIEPLFSFQEHISETKPEGHDEKPLL